MGISATLNNINSKTNNLYEHQSINFNSKLKCECIEIMKPYLFHFFQRSFLNCPIYNTSIVEIWMSYCFPWYDRKNPVTSKENDKQEEKYGEKERKKIVRSKSPQMILVGLVIALRNSVKSFQERNTLVVHDWLLPLLCFGSYLVILYFPTTFCFAWRVAFLKFLLGKDCGVEPPNSINP